MGAGFGFENPNVQSTCGCNSSFQVKPNCPGPGRPSPTAAAERHPALGDGLRRTGRGVSARDGGARIRAAFTSEDVALVESAGSREPAHPSPRALVASRPDDNGRFVEDFCNWDRLGDRALHPRVGRRGHRRRLMGSRPSGCTTTTCWSRSPAPASARRGTRTSRTTTSTAARTLSIWIPVDPVSRESTLEFVAGSHRGPWLMPRTFLDGQARWFPEGSLADLPDVEADPAASRSSDGRSSRATPSSSTCSRCTRRAASERPPGASRPLPRRRRHARAAGLEDLARVPRPGRRTPRRCADGRPALPCRLAGLNTGTRAPILRSPRDRLGQAPRRACGPAACNPHRRGPPLDTVIEREKRRPLPPERPPGDRLSGC